MFHAKVRCMIHFNPGSVARRPFVQLDLQASRQLSVALLMLPALRTRLNKRLEAGDWQHSTDRAVSWVAGSRFVDTGERAGVHPAQLAQRGARGPGLGVSGGSPAAHQRDPACQQWRWSRRWRQQRTGACPQQQESPHSESPNWILIYKISLGFRIPSLRGGAEALLSSGKRRQRHSRPVYAVLGFRISFTAQ